MTRYTGERLATRKAFRHICPIMQLSMYLACTKTFLAGNFPCKSIQNPRMYLADVICRPQLPANLSPNQPRVLVAYRAGSTRNDTVQWPSLSISDYRNQYFITKEINWRKAIDRDSCLRLVGSILVLGEVTLSLLRNDIASHAGPANAWPNVMVLTQSRLAPAMWCLERVKESVSHRKPNLRGSICHRNLFQ